MIKRDLLFRVKKFGFLINDTDEIRKIKETIISFGLQYKK